MEQKEKPQKKPNLTIFYLLMALLGIFFLQSALQSAFKVEQIPYSEFQQLLQDKRVEDVQVYDKYLQGTRIAPDGRKQEFITARVEPDIAEQLGAAGVAYRRVIESTFLRDLLSWLVPIFVFFAIWGFLMRRMASKLPGSGGLLSVGKSKAKVYMEADTKVNFADVAGVDEAKEELQEVVNFLRDPATYNRLGGVMPKGILLVGPPGTGKTLLAKAVAGEAKVPFFSISGSDFVEMFVGVGAARVRDLFEQARSKAPCIIFIDEIDALGRARSAVPGMGMDEKEQTLNQLLVELDGFDSTSGVLLLGATNRPELLDPALLRAGRFDRRVLVDRPDKSGRVAILKVHAKKIKTEESLDFDAIAALTSGFTGADLANLVNEAAIIATRRNATAVTLSDFTQGIERIVAGLEKKSRILNELERKIVAYHEMGHALVSAALVNTDTIHKVSIIPRGVGSLGHTIQRPTEDRFLMTKEELEAKLSVLLGGRAAEKVVFDHVSTGAADDLKKATEIAQHMVTRWGMEENLGNVYYDASEDNFLGKYEPVKNYSEDTAREIDLSVRKIVDRAYFQALAMLQKNAEVLEESAQKLLERETLSEQELKYFFQRVVPTRSEQRAYPAPAS